MANGINGAGINIWSQNDYLMAQDYELDRYFNYSNNATSSSSASTLSPHPAQDTNSTDSNTSSKVQALSYQQNDYMNNITHGLNSYFELLTCSSLINEISMLPDLLYDYLTINKPLYKIVHEGTALFDSFLDAISELVRSTGLSPDFSISSADMGAKILMMNKDGNGVYHADIEAWQQYFGYNNTYDIAFASATSMNRGKYPFEDVNGKDFIIWMWKGDYINLGAGAEIGIYTSGAIGDAFKSIGFDTPGHWVVDRRYSLIMAISLYYFGEPVYENYAPAEPQWWITGFNPKFKNVWESKLTLKGSVDFSRQPSMWVGFLEIYVKDEFWDIRKGTQTASFVW
jgi:hypothetical protein